LCDLAIHKKTATRSLDQMAARPSRFTSGSGETSEPENLDSFFLSYKGFFVKNQDVHTVWCHAAALLNAPADRLPGKNAFRDVMLRD
jgi:hypothetical protein